MENNILKELREIKHLIALKKSMLNLDEFCAYTGFSKNHAYKLTAERKIRYYRPCGKKIFFEVDDIVEFLKQNSVKSMDDVAKKVTHFVTKV